MNPHFNIQPSIEYQLQRIESRFRKEMEGLSKNKDNRQEYYKHIMRMWRKVDKSDSMWPGLTFLPVYYILRMDFPTAWTLEHYLNNSYDAPKEEKPDPRDWHFARDQRSLRKFWDMVKGPWGSYHPEDPDEDLRSLEATMSPSPGIPQYRIETEYRHAYVDELENYFCSYEATLENFDVLRSCMEMEMHTEAAECLFRLKLPMAQGVPPRYLIDFPKLKHFASAANMYDCWLQARLEKDREKQKSLAWTAIFWLLEHMHNTEGTDFEFGVDFDALCGIIIEFDLFKERQAEFDRFFKFFALTSSYSTWHKIIDDPIPMVTYEDIDGYSYGECLEVLGKKK